MRKDKKECKKGQESTIGKIIYGFLLFMPLLAIGTTCGYAMFNKNAYQSYSDEYVKSSIKLDSSNVNNFYVNGQNITYTFSEHNVQWNATFGFSDISIDLNNLFNVETTWNKFYLYRDNQKIMFYTTNNQTYILEAEDRQFNTFTYKVDLSVSADKAIYDYGIATIVNYTTDKLSDVFYYSVDKVTESPLFTWAENSIIYTTMSSTCTALSITTPFIPLLMSYWLIISVIYFLYDIALMLIWLIHRKIHELQESI